MSNIAQLHQLIDSLPSSLTLKAALLEQWCIAHNWKDLRINGEFVFRAVPPGGSKHVSLPKSAIAELEQKEGLVDIVQAARNRQHLFKESRQQLITSLLLNLPCYGVFMLANTNAATNAVPALIVFKEIRKEINLLTAGVIGIGLVFALITLVKYWKYRSLKHKIAILSRKFFKRP